MNEMAGIEKQSMNAVIRPTDEIVCIGAEDIGALKVVAEDNALKRARICAHKHSGDPVQEMIIVLCRDSYIPPHRHSGKSESFHIVEGGLAVVIFDEQGGVTRIIILSDYKSGGVFYYRLPENIYHTVIPLTELVVFHETVTGPFDGMGSAAAPFGPDERDAEQVREYVGWLTRAVNAITREKPND